MRVLVLNAGSSSLKAALIGMPGDETLDRIEADDWPGTSDVDWLRAFLERLGSGDAPDAVGHRVVHGGSASAPRLLDAAGLDALRELERLAPLHNGPATVVIDAARQLYPDLPHVACFDTAFHASLPEAAWRYALPRDWTDAFGIRRYGFHGLSVAWATSRTAQLLDRPLESLRLVVAHLGSGCSVTAVDGGRSVDTSMGFTPLEGLVMGTRAGSFDPGIVLHLLREGVEVAELDDGLHRRSGLAALAGGVASARELEAAADRGDAAAELALDVFARRAAAGIASAATALPGIDALTFTGGIGEHSSRIRAAVTARLGVLGIPSVDAETTDDAVLVASPIAVAVVQAREDLVIAREAEALLDRND